MKFLPAGTEPYHGMKTNITCDQCGSKMVVRKNSNMPSMFLGCSRYPECQKAEPFEVESKDQLTLF